MKYEIRKMTIQQGAFSGCEIDVIVGVLDQEKSVSHNALIHEYQESVRALDRAEAKRDEAQKLASEAHHEWDVALHNANAKLMALNTALAAGAR